MAERVFVEKLSNIGFTDIDVLERRPFSIADAAQYPLFTPELIALMRRLLPPATQDEVAVSVTLRARKPAAR